MTSFIAKKVTSKILKEHAGNQQGASDPYFEYVAATDMNGNTTGKTVKRKRAVPPGLTKTEEKVLKKVTRRAYRLDNAFNFCGIKVGWGAIFGLIPVIGDFADTLLALMVLRTIQAAQVPKALSSKMMFNIIIDFVIGLVPLLGDFGDALWRANTKNAALLYEHLEARGAERLRRGERPDGSENNSRHASPARGQGIVSQQPHRGETMEMRETHSSRGTRPGNVQQPQQARTKEGHVDRYNPTAGSRDRREVDLENGDSSYGRSGRR